MGDPQRAPRNPHIRKPRRHPVEERAIMTSIVRTMKRFIVTSPGGVFGSEASGIIVGSSLRIMPLATNMCVACRRSLKDRHQGGLLGRPQ